jgi:hypothetical protein
VELLGGKLIFFKMKSIENFKFNELSNQESVRAGAGVITYRGTDGNGNSIVDITDTATGIDYCNINDYDLDLNVGDTYTPSSGGGGSSAGPRR